jgi:general secretion pathway protein G
MRRVVAISLGCILLGGCTHFKKERERVLKDNLFTLRATIDQYTLDKTQAPQSLDDLVKAGYLRSIPQDPVTGKPDWEIEQCETSMSIDQSASGICDVHSTSPDNGTDGTPYSRW